MLFYRENGEIIHDAHISFVTDAQPATQIRRLAVVEGDAFDLRSLPVENFIIVMDDPFWVSTSDYVYLNPVFTYGEEMLGWIRAFVAQRSNVPVEIVTEYPENLDIQASRLSPEQLEKFRIGHPIWRRSALSCKPKNKKTKRSAVVCSLRNTIHAWIPMCESMARHAMEIDGDRQGSRFKSNTPGNCTALADGVLSRALGYNFGSKTTTKDHSKYKIRSAKYEGAAIDFGRAAYRFETAQKEPQLTYFEPYFSMRKDRLSALLETELNHFANVNRSFDEKFDASAIVKWSALILVALRIALAASLALDEERDFFKASITRKKKTDAGRSDTVRLRLRQQVTGLKVVKEKVKEKVKKGDVYTRMDIGQLLDLQYTVMIAFAANLNPTVINPVLDFCIRSTEDPEVLLAHPLFFAAQWLGNLFRKRFMQLEIHHAQALIAFADPKNPPGGLPAENLEEWTTTTRMITSFMTDAGRASLFDGAREALADGQPRQIYARIAPCWQHEPEDPARATARATMMNKLRAHSNTEIHVPPPVMVEAGWLVLPGNGNWFEQYEAFAKGDFPNEKMTTKTKQS